MSATHQSHGAHEVDLSVVIPAYNEERRPGPTLDAIIGHLREAGDGTTWEVIVVDDGSTDGTRDLVTAAAADEPRVQLITSPRNWRARARGDFAYWKAGVLVVAPQENDALLREAVEKLVGRPGTWVDGVWVWDLHEEG